MKILSVLMVGVTLAAMQSVHAINIGTDVLCGGGVGAASLGVFYGAQNNYFNETEGRALAASALAGILLSALIQAKLDGAGADYFITLAAAAGTFGLTKYIYEQKQLPVVSQEPGFQVGIQASASASV